MLGGRARVQPYARNQDLYAERANSSLSIYNAEPAKPATAYATTRIPLKSRYSEPTIGPTVRAFFKDSRWRMGGIIDFWSWGAVDQGANTASLPYGGGMDGTVRSTQFQRALVQLHDWSQYLKIRQGGWPATGSGMFMGSNPVRYTYPSFRVPQLQTRTSGGPGPVGTSMQPRSRFTAVQRVPKYTAPVRYYQTRSRTGYRPGPGGGSSNVNTTPGV